jgi:hypothetical protein
LYSKALVLLALFLFYRKLLRKASNIIKRRALEDHLKGLEE